MKKPKAKEQLKAYEEKLLEADGYIKELLDVIADKDNEIKRLNEKLEALYAEKKTAEENADLVDELPKDEASAGETETEKANNTPKDYHDFDFVESSASDNDDDLNTYVVKAISKIVTESVKIGCVLAASENEDKKELLNLVLGRTEVAKNEISSLISSNLDTDLIKASIDKECASVMEYYQSILAQL